MYQIIGEALMPIRNWIVTRLGLNRNSIGHKTASAIFTFILVDFAWIFFRADTTTNAFKIIEAMFRVRNPWVIFDGSLYTCGLDQRNFEIMLMGILVLLAVDICKNKCINIHEILIRQDFWCRWLIVDIAILVLLIFGIWGASYDAGSFIYFQF